MSGPSRPHRPSGPLPAQPPPDDTPTRALPSPRPTRSRRIGRRVRLGLRAQLPFLAVAAIVTFAFVRIALHHWREGAAEIGVALLVAAVLRARLTREGAGLLAVRGKRVDIVTYAVAGVVLILVALTITGGLLSSR